MSRYGRRTSCVKPSLVLEANDVSVGLRTPSMAKKKSAPKKAGRPSVLDGPKRQILGIRGSESYKDWLIRFAQRERSDMVDLVDDALAFYAKSRQFEDPPKR
jgi:hypothetical protein